MKIISGGQTGVDRAALDAAIESDSDCGGWCPEGRLAEDGKIPDRYPLKELPKGNYNDRTKQNVLDSDGTVIIYFSRPRTGTELTLVICINEHKPYCLIDAEEISIEKAVNKVIQFVQDEIIKTLNVAGPRASGDPRAYDYTKSVIQGLILETHNK